MVKKQLTIKEAKLIKGVASGKTKRQAGKDAGYQGTDETISVRVSNTLKKDNVQEALQEELIRQGISLEQIVAPVSKALKAQKKFYEDGELVAEDDDIELQLKGHDRAIKMLGLQKSGEVTLNFINQSAQQRDAYDL